MRVALPKLLVILGPTASGKTDLAVALAKRFRGEIISADSRQFYRGTDIGSDIIAGRWVRRGNRRVYLARGIPHHLIAIRPLTRTLTAADFKKLVVRLARDINRRGRLPILAGGTGLYINAVTENFTIPAVAPNWAFRKRLTKRGTAALFAELQRRDPAYAGRITPQNRRYITRALEVIQATGRPFSELQTKGEPLFDVLKIGIRRPRRELYARINRRVDAQIERGLLKEAMKLGKRYGWDLPPMTGLGHKQLGLFLRGEVPLMEAIRLIKRDTRRFAKRQIAWFKRDQSIRWVKNEATARKLVSDFAHR